MKGDASPFPVGASSKPTVPATWHSNNGTSAATITARPAYKPQFAESSSQILTRLRNVQRAGRQISDSTWSPLSSGTDGPSRAVHNTLAMPSPGIPDNVSKVAERVALSQPLDLKRKRGPDSLEADPALNTTSLRGLPPATPTDSQPGLTTSSSRLKGLSEAGDASQCSTCGQGSYSSDQDALVTCTSCQNWSHRLCTPVTADVPNTANYLCSDCRATRREGEKAVTKAKGVHERRQLINRIRDKQLSKLPAGVVPAKPELVGFVARQATGSERTEYFHCKKRADLLNILSWCDQLKPQLLVDIMVSVSKKHPDLPIFDDPDWKANLPSRTAQLKASTVDAGRRELAQPRQGLGLKESRKPKGRPKPTKPTTPAAADEVHVQVEPVADVVVLAGETSLPPTWPQAGQGLYAKLPPEDEDREFLVDSNDEEAFSQFMVDKAGKQMIVSACA